MKKVTLGLVFVSLLVLTGNSLAQKGSISGAKITRILIDADVYGGCMAYIDKSISTQASRPLNCPSSNWVTFSCNGTYNSKDIAYRKLDIAQKSEVTNQEVKIYIDDSKKHNGFCFAYRIISFNH